MSDIVKKLSLNKHPSDVPNYGLIQAKNIKISNDFKRIVNEEGISANTVIHQCISERFGNGYYIAGCVPTSNELILFICGNAIDPNTGEYAESAIYRYNETDNKCIIVNDQWKYHGGKLRGTYTYNINNHLIIQVAEDPYDLEEFVNPNYKPDELDLKVPLKTFDLDDWDIIKDLDLGKCIDGRILYVEEREVNNRKFENDTISISERFGNRADYVNAIVPQVPICNVTWGGLIKGNATKGIYTFFIRYKIDCWGNYTQWYPIGFPITVDSIESNEVSRYNWYYDYKDQDDESGHGYGCVDFYSADREFVKVLPKIRFKFEGTHDYLNFQKYQIGIIIKRLDTTKCYRTADFDRYISGSGRTEDRHILTEYEYIFNKEKLYDISLDELTLTKYNYYNVRNTINYQNRNYISNYTETNYNISEKEIGLFGKGFNIEELVKLNCFAYAPYVKTNVKFKDKVSQYDRTDNCMDEFCYDTNLVHTTTKAKGRNKLDQVKSWEKVRGYDYGSWHRIMGKDWTPGSLFGVPLNEVFGIDRNKEISVNGTKKPAYKFILCQQAGREQFAWWNRDDSRCRICLVENGAIAQDFGSQTTIIIDDKSDPIKYNCDINWMTAYSPMLDYGLSYESRLAHNTLIPGEVYSFYIHFVDKFGHSTNGFHIPNSNSKWKYDIDLNTTLGSYFNGDNEIPTNPIPTDPQLSVIFDMYNNNPSKWRDYKLYQFINNGGNNGLQLDIKDDGQYVENIILGYYANNSGQTFHRIPMYSFTAQGDERPIPLVFGIDCVIDDELFINELRNRGYIGYYLSYEKAEPMSRVVGFASETDASEDIDDHPTNHDLDNLDDKFLGDYNGRANYYNGNNNISTGGPKATENANKTLYVYSDDLNTSDKIKVDFNAISFRWALFDYRGFWQDQGTNKVAEYRASLNLPEVRAVTPIGNYDEIIYPVDEYEILIGDAPNNAGKGTRVKMKNPNVFNAQTYQRNAIATIWSLNNNIYTNPNKELIRINNIKLFNYEEEDQKLNTYGAYPGHITYNSTLVFRRTGARWDPQWTTVKGTDGCRYYYLNQGSYNVVSPQRLVQHICYWHRFMEGKVSNNRPKQELFILNINNQERFDDEKDTKRIAKLPNDSLYFHGGPNVLFPGRPVMPIQTLDMYKYVFPDETVSDKLLMAYDDNLRNITQFDKTIRRSDVIQDESYVNAWRTFQPNGYKIITENKGKIVNLIGIGLYLLAHTEHSMFMFDRTAALQTQDRDVKLSMPDAFDTKYVEVYTSDKGFAGIQDRFASIIGEFGYVFYNNDFHRFFKFDEKQLKYIDEDVRLWFEKVLPNKVRFANDKYNNRLIVCAEYGNKVDTLSFHNDTQTFISLHDYNYKYAYNTKVRTYMNRLIQGESLYEYNHESNYGRFNNMLTKAKSNGIFYTVANGNSHYDSYIDVIFNDQYEAIKFLEYIRYKVKKLDKYLVPDSPDNEITPVEDEVWTNIGYANKLLPKYSGDILRIFNEYCDSFDMSLDTTGDVNRYNRYKLPYFELGNWNFNYFRNNIPAHPGEPSDRLRRIYGNQIVVRFIFKNADNKRIEFETLDCIVTKQRNVR